MDKELQSKIIKSVEDSLTAAEAQVIWYLRKSNDNNAVIRLLNALKQLYEKNCDGIIRLYVKFSLTPEEILFLESIKDFSEDKLQNLREFMEKLLEEE
ncbi:MAG: hypothetical protein K2I23_05145 [Clostridia bacterium]|nr:hypothetical protein [Clostridia bacterium]